MAMMTHAPRRRLPMLMAVFTALLVGGLSVLAAAPAHAQAERIAERFSVEVIGQGPDVILIPGYASSREVWRPLADRLAATHRVHLVQLAGFAGEPWTHGTGPFLDPVLVALADYIRERGLQQPAVIGHSMGGLSGLLLAQRHPELVGRVMSVDSLPFFSALYGPQITVESARPFAAQAASQLLAMDEAAFALLQARTAVGLARDPAIREAMVDWSLASDRQALATAISEVMLTDARPGLAAMTTPVWAVYATDADGGPPPEAAAALWSREYQALPGVRLVAVDGARHFIMADQPQAFFAVVDDFLAE